jgi:hypothetical protein
MRSSIGARSSRHLSATFSRTSARHLSIRSRGEDALTASGDGLAQRGFHHSRIEDIHLPGPVAHPA